MNEIRISGFGGQGIIRCGYIIGETASLFDGKFATLTQSFGPEARGSACSAQIVVDEEPIRYPYLTVPDTVVAMSQEAYDKFGGHITDEGTLLIDEDLVKLAGSPKGAKLFSIPATRIAEQLGQRIVANIVMLGFFTAVTDIITAESVRKSLPTSVPPRFVDLNMKAFEQGYEYGLAVTGQLPEGGRPAPKKAAAEEAAAKPKPKKPTPGKTAGKPKPKKAAAAKRPSKAKVKKPAGPTRAKARAAKAGPKANAGKAVAKQKMRAKPRAKKK